MKNKRKKTKKKKRNRVLERFDLLIGKIIGNFANRKGLLTLNCEVFYLRLNVILTLD